MDQYINSYKKDLCEEYNLKPIKKWVNKDYLALSQSLSDRLNISISPNTLKRIFGKLNYKEGKFTPQKATLDALAQYLQYKDWNDFESRKRVEKARLKWISIGILGSLILIFTVFIIVKPSNEKNTDLKEKLRYELIINNNYAPSLVKVAYQLYDTNRNYYVNFLPYTSWKVPLLKNQQEVQSLYKNPGSSYNIYSGR